jgi:cytochrome c-type biogenesis protein CcmH/NrfG
MMFATVLAGVLAVVGFGVWRLLRARGMAFGNWIGAVALAVWLVAVVAMNIFGRPPARSELVRSMDSLAWPVAAESPLVRPAATTATATAAAGVQAAPVESLITGLEARLAAQPDDAKGWVLLAQSYAFTANEEGAERALRRAVELGVDEQSLRERLQGAKRSPHSAVSVEPTVGAGRP